MAENTMEKIWIVVNVICPNRPRVAWGYFFTNFAVAEECLEQLESPDRPDQKLAIWEYNFEETADGEG